MWQRVVGLKASGASFQFDESDVLSLGQGCQLFGRSYPQLKSKVLARSFSIVAVTTKFWVGESTK
jgi:hypothetical protein